MGDRYRAAPRAMLLIVPLDTLTAVYHRASGQTHLLAEPAPQLLELLVDVATTAGVLLANLAERFDVTDADHAALAARLDELAAIGLVERL